MLSKLTLSESVASLQKSFVLLFLYYFSYCFNQRDTALFGLRVQVHVLFQMSSNFIFFQDGFILSLPSCFKPITHLGKGLALLLSMHINPNIKYSSLYLHSSSHVGDFVALVIFFSCQHVSQF